MGINLGGMPVRFRDARSRQHRNRSGNCGCLARKSHKRGCFVDLSGKIGPEFRAHLGQQAPECRALINPPESPAEVVRAVAHDLSAHPAKYESARICVCGPASNVHGGYRGIRRVCAHVRESILHSALDRGHDPVHGQEHQGGADHRSQVPGIPQENLETDTPCFLNIGKTDDHNE